MAGEPERKKRSGVFGWLATFALAGALAWVIVWSGLSFNVVATDSMMPTLDPTDMVVSVDPKINHPDVGDVAVFTADLWGTPIPPHVHRIIGIDKNGNYITKGDNAAKPDPWVVKPQDVHGVVIAHAPTALIRNPFLLGGALFIMLALLFWPRGRDDEPESPTESMPDEPIDADTAIIDVTPQQEGDRTERAPS